METPIIKGQKEFSKYLKADCKLLKEWADNEGLPVERKPDGRIEWRSLKPVLDIWQSHRLTVKFRGEAPRKLKEKKK